jgi:hypothetical protein
MWQPQGLRFGVLVRPDEVADRSADVPAGLQRDLEPRGVRRRACAPRSISASVITASPDHDVEDAADRMATRSGTDHLSAVSNAASSSERRADGSGARGSTVCVRALPGRRTAGMISRSTAVVRAGMSPPSACDVASRADRAGGRATGSPHNQGGQDLVQPGRRTAEASIVEQAGGLRSAGCRVGNPGLIER